MVRAKTRLPASVRAATPPGVCSSSSSSSIPIWRSCSASCVRDIVVEFVTNCSRWPAHAGRAPWRVRPRSACRKRAGHRRRQAESPPWTSSSSLRDRVPLLPLERAGRPACRADSTRPEGLFDVAESAGLTEPERRRVLAELGPSCGWCTGRKVVAPQPRARRRSDRQQLREALLVRRKRWPTAPTKASPERRLDEKRRLAGTKRLVAAYHADVSPNGQGARRPPSAPRPAPRRPSAHSGGRGRRRGAAQRAAGGGAAETWVRTSMQYLSSSTIRGRPGTCLSMRRRRLSRVLVVA